MGFVVGLKVRHKLGEMKDLSFEERAVGNERNSRRYELGLIRLVLHKCNHYKSEHRRCLNEAAATLQRALPKDIVLKRVFFLLWNLENIASCYRYCLFPIYKNYNCLQS